jgi:hypothetical protein
VFSSPGEDAPQSAQSAQTPRVPLRQATPVALGKKPGGVGRNLALGIGAVLLSTPLAGVAFTWAPKETFVAATTGLLLALLMFLALQLHLLLQRHGLFVLMSVGLLLTLSVPVAVRMGSTGLDWMSDVSELRAARSGQGAENGTFPVFLQGNAKSSPFLPGVGRQAANGAADAAAQAAQPQPPFANPPVSSSPPQEAFSPEAAKKAEQVLLDQLLAKLSREDPQTATRMAQKEMQRRYPALEDPSSKEANLYRDAYNELGRLRKFDFFKDPAWPLKIAEMLASREGWKRADLAVTTPGGVELGAESAPSAPGAQGAAVVPDSKTLPGEEIALDGPGAPPAEDSHSQEVKRAMIEARRRYPGIGAEGSDENRAYLEVYAELDKLRPDFFSKSDWPIRLVELVAKREGWRRAAEPKAGSGAETADLPLPR